MLGCRAASASLVHAAACQHRHDGEHLGACAELDDREQIRIVVPEHVARDGDGVLTLPRAIARQPAGFHRAHDLDVETLGVVLGQILLDLLDHVQVVRAVAVQPEDRLGSRGTCSGHCELDPILDGDVLGLAHAPDVALLDLVHKQNRSRIGVHHTHGAWLLDLEGLVVGAVLLCLLRHEAHVRHRAHGLGIKCTMLNAIFDALVEDPGIASVRDDGLAILELVARSPHLAGGPDHGGHGCVDNDVAGHMQVGDALV
mmetsp:Transcript_157819/g.502599  ORF Transcript_157819/g.502599 Transcript_157819/m.502599 type:complete len:257 (-) Transcript_157819:2336-3106(-)